MGWNMQMFLCRTLSMQFFLRKAPQLGQKVSKSCQILRHNKLGKRLTWHLHCSTMGAWSKHPWKLEQLSWSLLSTYKILGKYGMHETFQSDCCAWICKTWIWLANLDRTNKHLRTKPCAHECTSKLWASIDLEIRHEVLRNSFVLILRHAMARDIYRQYSHRPRAQVRLFIANRGWWGLSSNARPDRSTVGKTCVLFSCRINIFHPSQFAFQLRFVGHQGRVRS